VPPPRRVGLQVTLELLYTGDPVDTATADEYGLVNRVLPSEELGPAADELAREIGNGPTQALVVAKDLVLDNLDCGFEDALDVEAVQQALLYTTNDHREGVRAFEEGSRVRGALRGVRTIVTFTVAVRTVTPRRTRPASRRRP
jgi:2-(1,2-epoxy-1,2-dihydrophenyl)acetyl-CoA isomerase